MTTIRDRESLLRGFERELGNVGDDSERREAIKAEIARVRGLPLPPSRTHGPISATEREARRATAYLASLNLELTRNAGNADRVKEISVEIARVEKAIAEGTEKAEAENARNTPKAERARRAPKGAKSTDKEDEDSDKESAEASSDEKPDDDQKDGAE